MSDPENVWIYHERQEALLCGQHALNNLAQANVFSPNRLANMAQELDSMELDVYAASEGGRTSQDYLARLREGSHHVDAAGNFSIEVLKKAVQQQFGMALPHLSQRGEGDITEMQGFLCHKSDHWFAIRQIGGRYWNLNSTLERPVAISHFTLATEMAAWQNKGYTVFCLARGLPVGGAKPSKTIIYDRHAHWHKMSDLLRGNSTQEDPWEKLNGAGMRLDGRSSSGNGKRSKNNGADSGVAVEGLTEDEMLQMAMQASLEPPSPRCASASSMSVPVPALVPVPTEPAANAPGAVRIQFKLPNNKRVVRRFVETDSVQVVYAYCVSMQEEGGNVELRCGFPPKDLSGLRGQTIKEAKLANESIQVRSV